MSIAMTRGVLAASVGLSAMLALPAARAVPRVPDAVCEQALPGRTGLVGVSSRDELAMRAAGSPYGLKVVGHVSALNVAQVEFPTATSARRGLAALRRVRGVRFAEFDRAVHALDVPADPMYRKQWGLTKIHAPAAWNIEVGETRSVTVAVIDTGVDVNHPDLKQKLLSGFNSVANSTDVQDDHGHGTHVAGIIAASTNNAVGIAGVSWGARILPIKSLDKSGAGSSCAILAGVVFATSQHVDVINMSLGGPGHCSAAVQEAVNAAHAADIAVVAAAGNSGFSFNTPSTPANCDHVLAVAATDQRDRAAAFSNFGDYVDLSAPGVEIVSTIIDTKTGAHSYAALSGTSMASPMVAGLAALIGARHPDWGANEIETRLIRTSRDLGKRGWDEHFGHGRIDAARAVA
jgi:subtilisin family serine protease